MRLLCRIARRLKIPAASVAIAVLLALGAGRSDHVTDLEREVIPLRQDLVLWEVSHLPEKWWRLATWPLVRYDDSEQARKAAVEEYFALGHELARAEAALEAALSDPDSDPATVAAADDERQAIAARREALGPLVEEAIESAMTEALAELGVINALGPIRWPPVDFKFEPGGLALVRSPRDEVRRMPDALLRSDIPLLDRVALEEETERLDPDVSALVVRLGGLSTYPAHVSSSLSLHGTLATVAHEWMHNWLVFRPLGLKWDARGELLSINETLSDIVGEEVGDLTLLKMTGEVVDRPPWTPPTFEPPGSEPQAFSFARYMNETRTRLDELLAQGAVGEAEAWLDERRLGLQEHGVRIRKLNTAYFAFHGTYAGSARGGSVNPIEGQLRLLRAEAPDLRTFVIRIGAISEEGELEELARAAGWRPPAE